MKIQVKLPTAKQYAYPLFGGGYDGSMFVCGPGMPHLPPSRIMIVDQMPNGEERPHSYEFDQGLGNAGGYRMKSTP